MHYVRFLFLLTLTFVSPVFASYPNGDEAKTLSPYFMITSGADEGVQQFPLKETTAKVNVVGVIADVKLTQTYENLGASPIEAIYVFPGSTRAAVYGMKMTVGDRVRIAKIKKKREAKRTYEKAKKAGKSASLLEQKRPNVFQMNVANILPGDSIEVELSYTELIEPESGLYEFVLPTVVGPRYSNQKASATPPLEHWVANPYLSEGQPAPYTFGLEVNLATGIPLKDLTSPSHKVLASYSAPAEAAVVLAKGEHDGGNRDFILRYRLQGNQIESGLLTYLGEEENFFSLVMEPPKRVAPEQIPPREYISIVDVSGSMHGFPLDISKQLLRNLLGSLRPEDKFNVLLFAASSNVLSPYSLPATERNVSAAINLIDHQRGGGGTELLPALKRAYALPREENISRSVVIATDGYVNVEAEAFELIRNNLDAANLFAFGIGSSVNRHLIEGLAFAGHGEPFVITSAHEAPYTAAKFERYINSPVLTNIEVDFGGFNVYDVEPRSIPDLFAERPLVLYGKFRGSPDGAIRVTGTSGKEAFDRTLVVSQTRAQQEHNAALRYLWARKRIKILSDYQQLTRNQDVIGEVTALGLTYNLLTNYTSFVAVDEIVRNPGGAQLPVTQPLPLPKGVSNLAVGSSVPSVPEPAEWILIVVGLLSLLYLVTSQRRNFSCRPTATGF